MTLARKKFFDHFCPNYLGSPITKADASVEKLCQTTSQVGIGDVEIVELNPLFLLAFSYMSYKLRQSQQNWSKDRKSAYRKTKRR